VPTERIPPDGVRPLRGSSAVALSGSVGRRDRPDYRTIGAFDNAWLHCRQSSAARAKLSRRRTGVDV